MIPSRISVKGELLGFECNAGGGEEIEKAVAMKVEVEEEKELKREKSSH